MVRVSDGQKKHTAVTLNQNSIDARIADLEREVLLLRKERRSNNSNDTEEHLALALDASAGVGVWDWDFGTGKIHSDAGFAKFFSLDSQQAADGVALSDFTLAVHPDDRAQFSAALAKAVETGSEYSAEFRIVQQHASIKWVSARGRCHFGANGAAIRFPVVVFDITERKQAEVSLAEKARIASLGSDVGAALAGISPLPQALQSCAQAIVDHLDGAFARIWTLDSTLNVLELQASAGLYTHLNGPHSQIPVGSFKIGRIAQERLPHLTNDVMHDSRISDREWALREGMVSFAGYPLLVEDRITGVLALFARHPLGEDIMRALAAVSTGIAIGIERKRAEAALRESEIRYRFLADAMPQIVWTATRDGNLNYVNGQGAAYFGVGVESLLGNGWLAHIHPDDSPKVVETWLNSISTGVPYEIEFRLRRGADGAWRWFLVRAIFMGGTISPATGRPDHRTAWVGTCTDINEQKEGRQALTRANRELEEFAYVASHDLQEPLRMVNVYTQLILKRVDTLDADLSQYASFVQQGVSRMDILLKDLLSFSRSVHTEAQSFGTAELSDSLDEALSVLKGRLEESGAVIRRQALPETCGETRQMAHVFQNLLSNALKYRRQVSPEINIAAVRHGHLWTISVSDNGIGFDPKYAVQIFGLFKRLHKDEYPGTGLGLAICQRIVERYGGRMWAESQPGEGSVFKFSLPAPSAD